MCGCVFGVCVGVGVWVGGVLCVYNVCSILSKTSSYLQYYYYGDLPIIIDTDATCVSSPGSDLSKELSQKNKTKSEEKS